MKSFKIELLNGFVSLNTLCPNGDFYYKITYPEELNIGNWGAHISFYDIDNNLIYYESKCYAHNIGTSEEFSPVIWSNEGGLVIYYSYESKSKGDIVFIDLKLKKVLKIVVNNINIEIFKKLKKGNFNKKVFLNEIKNDNIVEGELIKDELNNKGVLKKIFLFKKWYP